MIWGMVRHGQAVRRVPGEILGNVHDRGLTKEAMRGPLKGFLARLGVRDRPREIWTSPAPRAVLTAHLITEGLPGFQIELKDWLRDREYGDKVLGVEVYPEGLDRYEDRLFHEIEGGERLLDVCSRIADNLGKENYNDILIVSHELILQILYGIIFGKDFKHVYKSLTIDEGNYWRPHFGGPFIGGQIGMEVGR